LKTMVLPVASAETGVQANIMYMHEGFGVSNE